MRAPPNITAMIADAAALMATTDGNQNLNNAYFLFPCPWGCDHAIPGHQEFMPYQASSTKIGDDC